jgi:hypothetical protein
MEEGGDSTFVTDHVWVQHSENLRHVPEGTWVRFTAMVKTYRRATDSADGRVAAGGTDYGLHHPDDVDPPAPEHSNGTATNGAATVAADAPVPPGKSDGPDEAPPRDGLADLRMARAFMKHCGGPAKALEVLDNLPDMPAGLLRDYLTVLAED